MSLKDVALTYVGTPHINGGNVKGAGLDCCTLITQIYQECGYGTIPISFGYSGDWFIKKNCEELMLPYLEKYFDKKTDLEIGDCITFAWGRAKYAHIAMVIDEGVVIHCDADEGVEITELSNPIFYDKQGHSRMSGIWGIKK